MNSYKLFGLFLIFSVLHLAPLQVQASTPNSADNSADGSGHNSTHEEAHGKSKDKTPEKAVTAPSSVPELTSLSELCKKDLSPYFEKKGNRKTNDNLLALACEQTKSIESCKSVEGHSIYHYERLASKEGGRKILVFSLIHGDEGPAGTVGRIWMERLSDMKNPRNSWRVVPVLNPDGVALKTRTNKNKIDLNRNFPTKDWDELALKSWKSTTGANPRRFPGKTPASEPEVQCALKHIEDFRPDFVVSVHTPLKVLDFDGPKIKPPKFDYLPWKTLGHLPGSLGRYLWHERGTPVLTLELKEALPSSLSPLEELQDLIGLLASNSAISGDHQ